ncbi:conserved hypothetical protein [Desulfovibrionales bacterium]
MAVANSKKLTNGIVLLVSFLVVLWLIFVPFEGLGNKNTLEWSDDLFNKLSKGSSYFIPAMQKIADKYQGNIFEVSYPIKVKAAKMNKFELIKVLTSIVPMADATVTAAGDHITLKADLGKLLTQVNKDSDLMYKNDGKAIVDVYHIDEKKVISAWWELLSQAILPMQKKGLHGEAMAMDKVSKKSLEPALNYYTIPAESIGSKWLTVTCLLVFYVIYTLWYGYGIFELFAGMGLSASKPKAKKEV